MTFFTGLLCGVLAGLLIGAAFAMSLTRPQGGDR